MKIRTRLFLSAAFLIIVVSSLGVILFFSTQQFVQATQKAAVVEKFVREVFFLNALTNDYLLYHENRASTQWYIVYERINQMLLEESTDNATKEYIDILRTNLDQSKETFDQLTHSSENGHTSSLNQRLVGKLQVNAQSMIATATQMSESTSQEQERIRQWSERLLTLFIIFIIVAIIITNYLFYRTAILPITHLEFIAQQVRRGDLTKRADVSSSDEIGEFALTLNTMLDALKESHDTLERKVEERTQELQQANKDLESFSYSVSHDLRSPLRAIDGFSQILQEDYTKDIDEKGKEVIATIRKGAQYMAELIDDLLSFSRLGRQSLKPQIVDMNTMAHEVFIELLQSNPERKIHFTCESLPQVQADASLVRHVWINLLSNAIKYTKYKTDAIITVGFTDESKEVAYFVKDNGAGFDMKYVEKLFGVFQRLHSRREFDGTGVGLAIVSRIITKHGGRVWADGVVDSGATFYFSLPKYIGISEEKTYPKKEGGVQ